MTIEELKHLVDQKISENYTGDISAEDVNGLLKSTLDKIGEGDKIQEAQSEKLSELESDIEEVVTTINGTEKNYTEGYYLNASGNPTARADWGYTIYIPCVKGDVVEWCYGATNFNSAMLSICDSNKTHLDFYGANVPSGTRTLNFTQDNLRYIRASFLLSANAYIKINGVVVWSKQEEQKGLTQRVQRAEKELYTLKDYSDEILQGKSVVNTTTLGVISAELGFNCIVLDCKDGDEFIITGLGGNSTRLWGFADSSNAIIATSGGSASASAEKIVAPANAVKLAVNFKDSPAYSLLRVKPLKESVNENTENIKELQEAIIDVKGNNGQYGFALYNWRTSTNRNPSASLTDIISPYIPIVKGDKVEFYGGFTTGGYGFANVCDKNKVVISFYAPNANPRVIDISENEASFFRFTILRSAYGAYIKVNGSVVFEWSKEIEQKQVGILAFNNYDELTNNFINIRKSGVNANNSFVMLHFSDIHASDNINISRIVQLHSVFYPYLDAVVNTGDNQPDEYDSNDFTWYSGTSGTDEILNVIGNHDTASRDGSTYNWHAHRADAYSRYIAPFVSKWGAITQDGKCYYYKDFASRKVRLIVLDMMWFDSAQNTWLSSVLSSTPSDYSVVVSAHFVGQRYTGFSCNYGSMLENSGGGSDSQYSASGTNMELACATIDTWQQNGGSFACWVVGHTHVDIIGKVDSYPNQLVLAVSTAQYGNNASDYMCHTKDTKSQDCMNVIGIDTSNKLIKVFRIGANTDMWMRKKKSICLSYDTHSIVSEA